MLTYHNIKYQIYWERLLQNDRLEILEVVGLWKLASEADLARMNLLDSELWNSDNFLSSRLYRSSTLQGLLSGK